MSSFTMNDCVTLSKHFPVTEVDARLSKKHPIRTIARVLELAQKILHTDVTFSWFAGCDALPVVVLAKLFGKKTIVVVGGYEVASVPLFGYGSLRNKWSSMVTKFILKHADKILSVSKFNDYEIHDCADVETELIYNAVDCEMFTYTENKTNSVVTVGNATPTTCEIKGLKTFVEASLFFPDTCFTVVGSYNDIILKQLLKINPCVAFTGHIPHNQMVKMFMDAKVYCQLSYRESFGVSVAEAMSCGCVPVVTNVAALPEVVGDTGFYTEYGNVGTTVSAIRSALHSDKGKHASERISTMFNQTIREDRLVACVHTLMNTTKVNL